MKKFIIYLSFFILLFFITAKPANNLAKADTVITDNKKSSALDSFDSTDYSIEIQDSIGTKINLENWLGKNLLIIYAHSDCPFCKKLVKNYEAELQKTDLQVIVLFSGRDTSEIKEFRNETSLKYPYYFDYAYQFRKRYGTGIVPLSLFINSNGTAERIVGLKKQQIETLIQKLNKS